MYHENTMLQSEINNLRTRVKAMQETIDTLTQKNTLLLAEKATGTWINSGKYKNKDKTSSSFFLNGLFLPLTTIFN